MQTPCPLHTEKGPPYTTAYAAHCRIHYIPFFLFCTGDGKLLLTHSDAVYGILNSVHGVFLCLAGRRAKHFHAGETKKTTPFFCPVPKHLRARPPTAGVPYRFFTKADRFQILFMW